MSWQSQCLYAITNDFIACQRCYYPFRSYRLSDNASAWILCCLTIGDTLDQLPSFGSTSLFAHHFPNSSISPSHPPVPYRSTYSDSNTLNQHVQSESCPLNVYCVSLSISSPRGSDDRQSSPHYCIKYVDSSECFLLAHNAACLIR